MNGPAVRPRGIAARSKRGRIGSGSSSQRELPRLPSLRPITQVIHLGELRRCAQENCGYCRTFCIMFSGRCGWLIALTLPSTATAGWTSSAAPAPLAEDLGARISG
jgi:hypothetical protein